MNDDSGNDDLKEVKPLDPEQAVEQVEVKAAPAHDSAVPSEGPAAEDQLSKSDAASAPTALEATPALEGEVKQENPEKKTEPADDELSKQIADRKDADPSILAQSKAYTRRSFLVAGAAVAAGVGFYQWLDHDSMDGEQPSLLRRSFEANASLARALDHDHVLAPTYPIERAETLRVNGNYGLKKELLADSYRLQVVGTRNPQQSMRFTRDVTAWDYRYSASGSSEDQGHDSKVAPKTNSSKEMSSEKMAPADMMQKAEEDENHTGRKPRGMEESGESNSTLRPGTPGLLLTMQDVLRLPRHEFVTQFKCIEGWSQFVQWAGVRLADFIEAYPPALIDGKEPRYVYMETPDGDYYTGYDLDSCRHPQALLVTEMMGAPLTQFHGAPLRLHMPNKYGYKQIKRVALISYTNEKPDDYWTKLGYDWYGGL